MRRLMNYLKGIVMGVHITEVNVHIPERNEIKVMSSVMPSDNPTFNNVWESIKRELDYNYR